MSVESLKDLSAVCVVRRVRLYQDIQRMEIPDTLQDLLRERWIIRDRMMKDMMAGQRILEENVRMQDKMLREGEETESCGMASCQII